MEPNLPAPIRPTRTGRPPASALREETIGSLVAPVVGNSGLSSIGQIPIEMGIASVGSAERTTGLLRVDEVVFFLRVRPIGSDWPATFPVA